MPSDPSLCGVLLAGGLARRMGGGDKPLLRLGDKTLLGYVGAQRLLATGYPATYAQLAAWLQEYNDHPDAPTVYRLAQSRRTPGLRVAAVYARRVERGVEAFRHAGVPEDAIQLVPITDRAAVGAMLGAQGLIDIIARMKEANPFLSDEVAEHLTLHGTNWNPDRSLIWKFDNFCRIFAPSMKTICEF